MYIFTLVNGSVYYYTSWDQIQVVGGTRYLPLDPVNNGPGIQNSRITTKIGLQVNEVEIDIYAPPTTQVTNATPILTAFTQGLMDGATVLVTRLVTPPPGVPGAGTYVLFLGTVADIKELGRTHCKFVVRSPTECLDLYSPANLYQPSCRHTLFDAGCTLVRASYLVNGQVIGGSSSMQVNTNLTQSGPVPVPTTYGALSSSGASNTNLLATTYYVVITYVSSTGESTPGPEGFLSVPKNTLLHVQVASGPAGVIGWNVYVGQAPGDEQLQNDSPLPFPATWIESNDGLQVGVQPPAVNSGGYFSQGRIIFTSGTNAGLSRYVDVYLGGGVFHVVPLLPNIPQAGDMITAQPGCDKTLSTCTRRYLNQQHYGGEPFIPDPASMI